jgi:SPP1 family predicted phage head-tail adaptor
MARPCVKNPAARMKFRVEIQSLSQATDNQGGFTDSWTTDATVWAEIEPLKGWERFQAQQTQTPLTHKVTMRYRSGVTTAKRLLYGSRVFEIKEVINVNEDSAFLVLRCLEQV